MAVLKIKDAKALTGEARESKIKELRFELIKSNVTAHKSSAKTKEIKKALARLLTLKTKQPEVHKKN